jgi:hypothetical protein
MDKCEYSYRPIVYYYWNYFTLNKIKKFINLKFKQKS